MNEVIKRGTYTIVCSKCKYIFPDGVFYSREEAEDRRNQMWKEGVRCPNGCQPDYDIIWEPTMTRPISDAEHPYGIEK